MQDPDSLQLKSKFHVDEDPIELYDCWVSRHVLLKGKLILTLNYVIFDSSYNDRNLLFG